MMLTTTKMILRALFACGVPEGADETVGEIAPAMGMAAPHLGQNLAFYPSGIEPNFQPSANWIDVVAGAKIAGALTPKVLVTVFGDAGGGQANSDYQVGGLLGYKISEKIILQAGWRYLDVNYRTGAPALFIYDAHESGILFGMNWILK